MTWIDCGDGEYFILDQEENLFQAGFLLYLSIVPITKQASKSQTRFPLPELHPLQQGC